MARITRRGLFATGGATLGGATPAPAQEMAAHERELHEAARREGELTWYTGQLQAEPSEAVGRAFTERIPA